MVQPAKFDRLAETGGQMSLVLVTLGNGSGSTVGWFVARSTRTRGSARVAVPMCCAQASTRGYLYGSVNALSPTMSCMALNGTYVPSTFGWVRDQVELYERSGGSEGNTLRETGLEVIIVSMRGAKSANVRKIALMKVEHNGEYALVASMGGAPKNPVWYHNLVAAPDEVTVQDGPVPFDVSVREITGDERATWWGRCVAAFAPYADYQVKTERLIPVLIATPKG